MKVDRRRVIHNAVLSLIIFSGVQSFSAFASNYSVTSLEKTNEHPAYERLKGALQKLNTENAVSGRLNVAFSNARGEGKKLKEESGEASVTLTYDSSGLSTSYSPALLQKINQENEAKLADEDAKTPTLSALSGVSMANIIRSLSPVPSILRYLQNGKLKAVETLKAENANSVQSETFYRLHFDLPMEAFIDDKETRGYVDDFDGSLIITTDAKGAPTNLETRFAGSGRAYVFFKVSASGETSQLYEIVNGRLISTKREVFAKFETTFGDGESFDSAEFIPNGN